MNKICPYCGRAGAVGVSCDGCGYILRKTDKDLQTLTPEQSSPVIPSKEPALPEKRDKKESASPKPVPISPPKKAVKPAVQKSYVIAIAGVFMILYGVYGIYMTTSFYFNSEVMNGITGNAMSSAMISGGLLVYSYGMHLNWNGHRKKILKWILVLSALAAFGIPLILMLFFFIR